MATEVHFQKRKHTRVAARKSKASFDRRRLLFLGRRGHGEDEQVLDIGRGGMRVFARTDLRANDRLDVVVKSPSLDEPIKVEGRVRWVKDTPVIAGAPAQDDGGKWVGIEFVDVTEPIAAKLDRVLLSELGSRVSFGGKLVGWIAWTEFAEGSAPGFNVYDPQQDLVATITDEGAWLRARRTRHGRIDYFSAEKLEDNLRWVFNREGDLAYDPPLEGGRKGS